jgi:hypothetical protein
MGEEGIKVCECFQSVFLGVLDLLEVEVCIEDGDLRSN